MQREWYEGINHEWIETVHGYLEITARMIEDTARCDDAATIPDVVTLMRREMQQIRAYLDLVVADVKVGIRGK